MGEPQPRVLSVVSMGDWGYQPDDEVAEGSAKGRSTPPGGPEQTGAHGIGAVVHRTLLGLAGLGMLVGFFMPWLTVGDMVTISGFDLLTGQGRLFESMAGPGKLPLAFLPVSGALLVAGAVTGHRLTAWLGLGAGGCGLVYGLLALVRLFFRTTGPGMWTVVVSLLIALGAGLVALGARRRRRG